MSSLINAALYAQGYTNQALNEKLIAWARDNGATSYQFNLALLQVYQANGGTASDMPTAGQQMARSLGYDSLDAFWAAGGTLAEWAPSDLANVEWWFDAGVGVYNDAGITPASALDDVQEWHDQSGNNRDLTQTTAGFKPQYLPIGGPNSTPAIDFDRTTTEHIKTSIITSITGLGHMFIVFKQDAWASGDTLVSNASASLNNLIYDSGTSPELRVFSSAGTINSATGTPTLGSWHWAEVLFNNPNSTLTLDADTATTGGAALSLDGVSLGARGGATSPSDVAFSEVIVVSSEVTGTDLTDLRSYITDKYALTTN